MVPVGIPCAVAVKQVLDGTLAEKGVLAPMNSKVNDPLIKELKEVSNTHYLTNKHGSIQNANVCFA